MMFLSSPPIEGCYNRHESFLSNSSAHAECYDVQPLRNACCISLLRQCQRQVGTVWSSRRGHRLKFTGHSEHRDKQERQAKEREALGLTWSQQIQQGLIYASTFQSGSLCWVAAASAVDGGPLQRLAPTEFTPIDMDNAPQFLLISVGLVVTFWLSNYFVPSAIMKNTVFLDEEEVDVLLAQELRENSTERRPKKASGGFGSARADKDASREITGDETKSHQRNEN